MAMVAVCYGTGLLLARAFPWSWIWLLGTAWGLALVTLLWGRARYYLLWPLLALVGWANLAWRASVIDPYDLRRTVGDSPILTTVRGRLCQTPELRLSRRNGQTHSRLLGRMEVHAYRIKDQWQPARGRIIFSHPGLLDEHFYTGMPVEATGVLAPPPRAPAPGLFDYREYLQWLGIYYQLRTERASDWAIWSGLPAPAAPSFSDRFLRWAKVTLARGLPGEDESLRLIWAMALGWKTALTDEVSLPFMQTGTMHIFAISGMHIALMAGIVISLLRALQMSRAACGWLVIPMIWFYTGATGWQSSAIRSSLMMTVVIGGWALRRPGDLLNSLAASAFLLCLWEPQQLFQASFQLSFFVVLSLGLLYPVIQDWREHWLRPDPHIPEDQYSAGWHRRRWLIRISTDGLAASLASWLGSAPIIAYYFHLVTPVSLLANILIVPLSTLTLMCNLGSVLCGPWFGYLTTLFNHSAWLWMEWTVRLCDWFATFPGSYFYVPTPNGFEFAGFYLLVLLAAFGGRWDWRLRTAVLVLLMALALADGWWIWRSRQDVTVTVLSAQGGEAIYGDAPGGKNDLLLDCGNEGAADFVVIPFLQAQGINRLARCVLSHGDARHVAGAPLLRETYPLTPWLAGPVRFRSRIYQNVLSRARAQGVPVEQLAQQDQVGDWRVLHPRATDRFPLADDASLALKATFQGVRLLLCPDLAEDGQKALLQRGGDLESDILVTSWPSRGEPAAGAFLEASRPRLVVLNGSPPPGKAALREKVRQRLRKYGIELVENEDYGARVIKLRSGQWSIASYPPAEYPEHMGGRK